jgi:hypothetical protein
VLAAITKFISHNRFRKEIIIIIVLKVLAIFAIWGLFFSHPLSKQLTVPALVEHYIQ